MMMKGVVPLLLLLLLGLAHGGNLAATTTSHVPTLQQRQEDDKWSKNIVLLLGNNNGIFGDTTQALQLRGGAELELPEEDDSASFLVTKTRNIVRSLLQILDRKSPVLGNLLRTLVKLVEKLSGVRLLPKPSSNSKRIKTPKKRQKQSESTTKKERESSSSPKPKASKKKSTKKKSSSANNAATSKHLDTKLSNKSPNYRIQRELKEFLTSPPPNLSVKVGSNIRIWIVTMTGAKNTIYDGEVYKLRVQFPKDYPTVPPSVYFLQPPPQHEHVYTNGDICLSLLGKGWRPTMTAQSIAVSILSILSSAQSKSIPMDNAQHSQNKPGQYQKDWIYHDDNC